jgi:8-oxo-dGTP pyrophosphatase MutT (NUDIX family)
MTKTSKSQSAVMSWSERFALKVLRVVSPKLPRSLYVILGRALHFFTIAAFARSVDGVLRVRVALVNEGKVYVVKNWYGNGKWGLPGGGIEESESDAEGLQREVKEELGYDLDIGQVESAASYDYTSYITGSKIPCRVFIVSIDHRPTFTLNKYEIVGEEWVDLDDLPKTEEFAQILL